MTKPKLRIGLIGSGFMGKTHAFGFAAAARVFDLPFELELHTLADINDEAAAKAGAALGFAQRDSRLADACRRSRDRRRRHHRAERAAQGDGARRHRRGQARLLREAAGAARGGRARDGGGRRGRRGSRRRSASTISATRCSASRAK